MFIGVFNLFNLGMILKVYNSCVIVIYKLFCVICWLGYIWCLYLNLMMGSFFFNYCFGISVFIFGLNIVFFCVIV